MVDGVNTPGPSVVPDTPLLRYFRSPPYAGKKGRHWGEARVKEAQRLLADPARLPRLFADSVALVESTYRNYQPFHPEGHTFGVNARTQLPHGQELASTADIAARLAARDTWNVPEDERLAFVYVDREIELTRSKPTHSSRADQSVLRLDLFLANTRDRMPILCEAKLREDQCALYALVQLLTQAAYAATRSQRERLVLFGSRPDFVLQEAVPDKEARLDLYVLLVEPSEGSPHSEILPIAINVGRKTLADPLVSQRIRRLAWIHAEGTQDRSLALRLLNVGGGRSPVSTR